jgi:hypothetical protein
MHFDHDRYITLSLACFGSYQDIIRETNAREHIFDFTVTLESTTYVCTQYIMVSDIIYVYYFLLIQYLSQYMWI